MPKPRQVAVLWVGDTSGISRVQGALASMGISQTVDFVSTHQAVESAAQGRPDLIVLDVVLPSIKGLETLMRLSRDRRTRTIPLVVLATVKEASHVDMALDMGARAVIAAPSTDSGLPSTITEVLAHASTPTRFSRRAAT